MANILDATSSVSPVQESNMDLAVRARPVCPVDVCWDGYHAPRELVRSSPAPLLLWPKENAVHGNDVPVVPVKLFVVSDILKLMAPQDIEDVLEP